MLRIDGYSITTWVKNECDEEHTENLLKSIMINETWINRRVKAKEFIDSTIPTIEVMKHA
jgi:hypothetical protein